MTSTLDRSREAGVDRMGPDPVKQSRLPLVPSGRRPLLTVLSALLVFGSVAAFATVYAAGTHQQSVLIVTRTIEQGQPIRGSDLGQASAAISGGVDPIPVSDAGELAGRRAATTIPAGTLLTIGDTTSSEPIGPGDAVVGMALKPGQLPADGLSPGDQVMVVETVAAGSPVTSVPPTPNSGSGDGGSGTGVLVSRALVFGIQPPASGGLPDGGTTGGSTSGSGTELVSVEVSNSVAPSVASAATAGQVSLVLLPPPSVSGQSRGGGSRPS